MKRLSYIFTAILSAALIFAAQGVSALALTVNSETVQTGDTILFEIHASDCPQSIVGMDIAVSYDESVMQYVEDTLDTTALSGAITNTNLESAMKLAWIDYTLSGVDFGSDTVLLSVKFSVISDSSATADITYEMGSFIGADYTEYDGSSYTYSVTTVVTSSDDEDSSSAVSSIPAASDTDMSVQEDSDSTDTDSDTQTDTDTQTGTDDEESTDTQTDTEADEDTEADPTLSADTDDSTAQQTQLSTDTDTADTADTAVNTIDTPQAVESMTAGIAAFIIVAAVIIIVGIIFFAIFRASKRGKHVQ